MGLLSKVYIRRLGGWWMLQFSYNRLGEKLRENNFFYILQRVDGWVGVMPVLRIVVDGQWRPAIGGRPHCRPPRRRVSPTQFFLTDCDWL